MAKGYAIVLLDVRDHGLYVEYARRATEIEGRYGGRAVVAGEAAEVVEGVWPSGRVVVLEFPSLQAARDWYADPDYRDLIPMRHRAAASHMLFMEEFAPAG
jgi:uncharacterized protein (DUF1330 family)